MNGDREGDEYTKEDLPVIAYFFADYFGVKQERLRTSDLERVKWHIREILVALNLLETTDNPLPRRSTRISNDSQDMDIDGIPSQRVLHQRDGDTRRSNSPDEVSESDGSLDAILGDEDMTHQAAKRALKKLLARCGDDRIAGYRRVGILEAAFKCAHGDGTIVDLNTTLFALACPDLVSPNEFDRIAALPKRKLSRLLTNFKQIKEEVINKEQLFQISPDKLILEWLHDARRYSDGETFPRKMRDKQGQLKPEIAFMFRHIYFTNPRLGFKCLNDLFVSFFVNVKPTQKMMGDQLLEASQRYTAASIKARTTVSFQEAYSIRSIVKRGTNVGKKQLDEKKVAHAEAVAAKKRQSTTYSQTSLEDQEEAATTLVTANDLAWKSKDAIERAKRLDKVLKKSYWKDVPSNCFFEELEKVLPRFYNRAVSGMTKTFVLRTATETCTEENNLGQFIKLVRNIADGKTPNTLSTKRRADQLKKAKATKMDILAEFTKVEDSIYLSVVEEKDFQKHAPMRAIIESFGTEIAGHARYQLADKKDLTTTFVTSYIPPK